MNLYQLYHILKSTCDIFPEGYVSDECSESLLQKCDTSFYPGAAYCNTGIYYSYLEIKAMTSSSSLSQYECIDRIETKMS